MMVKKIVLTIFLLWLQLMMTVAASASCSTPRAEISLRAWEKNSEISVEIILKPRAGWYIHSHNPGAFGMSAQAKWNGADVLKYEEWSEGEDIIYQGFGVNVYKEKGIYQAIFSAEYTKNPKVELSFMSCSDECIPETVNLEITPENLNLDILPDKQDASQDVLTKLWLKSIILAFCGGLLLNLMPCVFPVLFIKIIGVTQTKPHRKRVRDAWAYMAGVIACFLVLAALLQQLKMQGVSLGWGFQLQSPIFVGIMAVVFLILGLMFLDIITINTHINLGSGSAFLTGLLAVMVASPCTAPFMGATIGWILTSSISGYVFYSVFAALGIGYALPFFGAEMFPSVMRKILPRPGKWMIWLKKIMALPMFLTCFWLLWILRADVHKPDTIWETYDAEKAENLIKNGEKVFIDFTARWCLTCLVNKKNVLDTAEFAKLSEKNDVYLFRADWTSRSDNIKYALSKYGRASIPLYMYYDGKQKHLLPQILTFDMVKNIIEKTE